jgi:hypothetical protein
VENIGEVLALAENESAIRPLVDCSEWRMFYGGVSQNNFPAISPLLRFGDRALPLLEEKYVLAEPSGRCRIASIIGSLQTSAAQQTIERLLSSETDTTVHKCLEAEQRALRSSINQIHQRISGG